MSATYVHTNRKRGFAEILLRILALLYFIGLAASIAYLWVLTENRYVTTATFKVAKANESSVDSSAMLQMAVAGLADPGFSDAQTVIGFISSSDLLIQLENEFGLVEHYTTPTQDWVFRMEKNWPLEERLEFYRERISANFDLETGLTTLSVDTFEPLLSHKIAESILKKAESFVNGINQQIADQKISFVRGEVEHTCLRVDEINSQLLELQNEHKLITPDELIITSVGALREMQMDKLRADTELTTLQRDSPGSPMIEQLQSRIRSLQELIDIETAKISGPERERMNQILLKYRELQRKLELANQLRTSAELMLEKNRVEAAARSRFLSVIQHPFMPEDVAVPRRWYVTTCLLVLGILIFLIFRALTHSVFERA